MLRFHELQQNPVSITFRDRTGAMTAVVAMRLREGIVKMTCQCRRFSQVGWCKHCLAAFSDREVFDDNKHREAFESLVGATYLEEAAKKLIKALDAFAFAYRQMKFRGPSDLDPRQLRDFADCADHAGISANDLALAVEGFVNEAAAKGPARRNESDPTSASVSKAKESVLERLRRVLMKDLG
jgi:hypothetical protein